MLPLFNYRVTKSGALVGIAVLLAMGGAFVLAAPVFWTSTLGRVFMSAWLLAAALAGAAYVRILRRPRAWRSARTGVMGLAAGRRDQRHKAHPRARGLARG